MPKTFGLAIWWLDVVNFGILSPSAAVSADIILMGFWLLSSSFVFLLGCGSGLTIFKFHHIAKSQNVCDLNQANRKVGKNAVKQMEGTKSSPILCGVRANRMADKITGN